MTDASLNSFGSAVFGQLDWNFSEHWNLILGGRYNYDSKIAQYNRKTYGGLSTTDPALLALKKLVYTNQDFLVDAEGQNFSGNITLSFKPNRNINAYATLSNSYKPFGINLGGLPTENGRVMTELAKIKPEFVLHYEVGLKSKPSKNSTLNVSFFNTDIKDFQTQVQSAEIGVNRGYLANAEKVRVFGAEADFYWKIGKYFTLNTALVYTDGKYVQFTNAPVPLEEVGGSQAYKDISGGRLPGISKWTHSLGGEFSFSENLLGMKGKYFVALDSFYRSAFSSSPSPSQFLNVDGYSLLNGRLGFRADNGFSVVFWSRNLTNKNYFEQLLPAGGSSGYFVAVLGDQRTYGVTLRYSF